MDILICRVRYPNDPTNNLIAHQNFISVKEDDHIIFYSISSIMGKEKRVYTDDGEEQEEVYILKSKERIECGLRVPSFIDCTKSYKVTINDSVDLTRLSSRSIPSDVKEKIQSKIDNMALDGNHTEYSIPLEDFSEWNYKCKV